MEELVLKFIETCIEENRAKGKFPANPTLKEISKRIDAALEVLSKEGKIRMGETVNDKYIELL